jgi:hypothetical protein
MSKIKAKLNPEQVLKEDFEKPNGLEMVIVPKNQFLEWFKHMKGIMGEMEVKGNDDVDWIERPNCRSVMESYTLNNDPGELWYLCPNATSHSPKDNTNTSQG